MKNIPSLQDFQRWRQKNTESFSLLDYLYGSLQVKNVSPDVYVAFVQLCWPDVVEEGGLVLLAVNYDLNYLSELKEEETSAKDIEYWMNLVCLDGMIETSGSTAPDDLIEHTSYIASKLKEMWTARLELLPDQRVFQVNIVEDSDSGDTCITFYQG